MKVPKSQAKKPERRRVSHRKELAVVTLAMVASISGVGGLLASGQQSTPQAGQPVAATERASAATSASPSGTTDKVGTVAPTSQREDDDGEINDDVGKHAVLRSAKAKPAQNGAPSWSATSQTPAPAVSQGSPPIR